MRAIARAELVAAVVNAGCMGFLSAHTQPNAQSLRDEIRRTRALTTRPFGVNLTVLPMLTGMDYDGFARVIIEQEIPFVETSGSNPSKWIDLFKTAGIKVLHKCPSSIRFARKAEELGADAVILHGVECGGHPGEDDIPGLVLIPAAVDEIRIPVLSSGGVADGRGLAAVLALGAEAAVIGTRFMLTQESMLHPAVKQRMLAATIRDTVVIGRSVRDSSRVLRNRLAEEILEAEKVASASYADLFPMIGAERWIDASLRADPDDGAFPTGLSVGLVKDIPSCATLVPRIVEEATSLIAQRLQRMVRFASV